VQPALPTYRWFPGVCLVVSEETPFEPVWSDSVAVRGAARRSLSHLAASLESQWGKRRCYCWLLACLAHARRRAEDSVGAGRRSVLSAEAVFMKDSDGVPGQARRASHAAVGPAIQVICLVSDCFLLCLLSWSLLWFGIVFVRNLLFVSVFIYLYIRGCSPCGWKYCQIGRLGPPGSLCSELHERFQSLNKIRSNNTCRALEEAPAKIT